MYILNQCVKPIFKGKNLGGNTIQTMAIYYFMQSHEYNILFFLKA